MGREECLWFFCQPKVGAAPLLMDRQVLILCLLWEVGAWVWGWPSISSQCLNSTLCLPCSGLLSLCFSVAHHLWLPAVGNHALVSAVVFCWVAPSFEVFIFISAEYLISLSAVRGPTMGRTWFSPCAYYASWWQLHVAQLVSLMKEARVDPGALRKGMGNLGGQHQGVHTWLGGTSQHHPGCLAWLRHGGNQIGVSLTCTNVLPAVL